VVDEVSVTTTLLVFLVCGLVSVTVTVEPLRAATAPEAAPKLPAPENLPPLGGACPVPPVPKPPEGLPLAPPPPPPLNPPNPVEQLPPVGWVIETVVAVTGPPKAVLLADDDVVGLPNAEMHEPTVTLEADAVTV
jgi:hypothetical protein